MDAITAVALAVRRGAQVPSSDVEQLCRALDAVSEAARTVGLGWLRLRRAGRI